MKNRNILLAAALAGGLLSASAYATTAAAHHQSTAALKIEAPVPVRIVSPERLPRSAAGSIVTLSLTIDADGRPHDIKVVSRGDHGLTKSLQAAVSQWQFAPARRDGVAVPVKVLLPLELIEAENS